MRGFLFFLFILSACSSYTGPRDYMPRSIKFADREWWVKASPEIQGPGNNIYHHRNTWVDWAGHLHLKVNEQDKRWTCAEVYSKESMGYGRYKIEVEGHLGDLDPNVVFGFFTWDPDGFENQANSEIDIEFSKWGYPLAPRVLHYSVHPVSLQKLFLERFQSSNTNAQNWNGRSTHIIEWRDTSISFFSYKGKEEELLESFHYSFNNPPRRKGVEGNFSEPITVPKPGPNNQARLNLWVFGTNEGPYYGKDCEVIIRDFSYEAF